MRFHYAPDISYADVGSGHVLYSAPGFPGFPARLAIELFERARDFAGVERAFLWDPLCGAGGMISTLGFSCAGKIRRILATDISCDAIVLARRNLALLSSKGLARRANELREMGADPARIASAEMLKRRIEGQSFPVDTSVVDATDPSALANLDIEGIDIVLSDLPYGVQTEWRSVSETPFVSMLEVLKLRLAPHAVLVFSSTDRRAFAGAPRAFRSFKHGHRTIKMYRADTFDNRV